MPGGRLPLVPISTNELAAVMFAFSVITPPPPPKRYVVLPEGNVIVLVLSSVINVLVPRRTLLPNILKLIWPTGFTSKPMTPWLEPGLPDVSANWLRKVVAESGAYVIPLDSRIPSPR